MKLLIPIIKRFLVSEYIKLEDALKDPLKSQNETLHKVLEQTGLSTESFNDLPIRNYENFHNLKNLTKKPPLFFETTSGSSGSKKRIPYTKTLINDFTQMFKIWAYDILSFGPRLTGGSIYFSISPQFSDQSNTRDDSDYLTGVTGFIFNRFVLVPSLVKKIKDPIEFKKAIALYMISARRLEIVSIWSPSFFIVLLETIVEHHKELEKALKDRCFEWKEISFNLPKTPIFKIHEIKKASPDFNILFPHLKLVSCWGALNSKQDFEWLKKTFPNTLVQEKGLLATEAAISIPSIKYGHFLPALNQTFFEFISKENKILRIHELKLHESYEILISQSSGLLRYRLGDVIKVTSIVRNTPCFEFQGRANNVSDLVGEKLNEIFLMNKLKDGNFPPCIFIPSQSAKRYFCISEYPLNKLDLEKMLNENPHYRNAVKLGQLKSIRVIKTENLNRKLKEYFTHKKNMKLGDIKDQILYRNETDNKLIDHLI